MRTSPVVDAQNCRGKCWVRWLRIAVKTSEANFVKGRHFRLFDLFLFRLRSTVRDCRRGATYAPFPRAQLGLGTPQVGDRKYNHRFMSRPLPQTSSMRDRKLSRSEELRVRNHVVDASQCYSSCLVPGLIADIATLMSHHT